MSINREFIREALRLAEKRIRHYNDRIKQQGPATAARELQENEKVLKRIASALAACRADTCD